MTDSIARNPAFTPSSPPLSREAGFGRQRSDIRALSTPDRRVPVIDKTKVEPDILKAAEGMEGMFLEYMMKVMRETVPKNEMDLENQASDIYRGMMDSENVQKAVHAGGVGLSDTLIAYLQAQRYNQDEAMRASQGQLADPHSQQKPIGQIKKDGL